MKRLSAVVLALLLLPTGALAQDDEYGTSELDVDWSETQIEVLQPGLGRVVGLHNEDFCKWIAYNLGVEVAQDDLAICATGIADQQSAWVPESMLPAIVASVEGASQGQGIATPSPSATPTATPKPTPKATKKPKPIPYKTLSKRAWQRLIKAPDRYSGKRYRMWACITQFDAATGEDSFRGQASYKKQPYWYSDGDNALFTGNANRLDSFVQDDIVWLQVESLGSFSYGTQIGGNTTVPLFSVDRIKRVKGSC
jgi:hypothetical protein